MALSKDKDATKLCSLKDEVERDAINKIQNLEDEASSIYRSYSIFPITIVM